MRRRRHLMLLLVLALTTCLGACAQTAPAVPVAEAAAAPLASTPAPLTAAGDAGLAIAVARDAATRAAREQTLHVQKLLHRQQREQQQAREAIQRGDGNARCLAGQKMRRVTHGWVQAGTC